MRERRSKSKKAENMIYTEEHHIALGQAIKTESGEYALRVKKDQNYDVIPMGKLMAQIVQLADATA